MRDEGETTHDDSGRLDGDVALLGDTLTRWSHSPTVKQRTAVRRELHRLLDELAPERKPERGAARPTPRVALHRSPRGCILQSTGSAVSVSWFPAADTDMTLGELVVSVWRGVVSHPGSARRERDGAVLVHERTLRPVEVGLDRWGWRATDDSVIESAALAEWCREQMEQQIGGAGDDAPTPAPRR